MKTMNNIILMILISAGALSLAMAVINEVPVIWSLILPWLRPPYLHVVINGIIIAIAAASRFYRNHPAPPVRQQRLISAKTPPPEYYAAYSSPEEVRDVAEAEAGYEREDRVVELKPVMVNGREVSAEDEGEITFADMTLTCDTPSPEIFPPEFQLEYYPTENPNGNVAETIVSGRMVPMNEAVESSWEIISEEPSRAAHEEFRHGGEPWSAAVDRVRYKTRKSKSFTERTIYSDSPPSHAHRNKAPLSRNKSNRPVEAEDVSIDRLSLTYKSRSPETFSPENDPIENIPQRARGPGPPATAEEYETLESAWKKITEGASRAAASREEARYISPSSDGLKSRSFKERAANYNVSPPSRLSSGKEVSPSQDELNRRVEAFIKKVNEEIRLRRQNSSNQYIQLNSAA